MNKEIESLLIQNGASMVGFARIEDLYSFQDDNEPQSADSTKEQIVIPKYKIGIAIGLKYPKNVISNISNYPTIEYYNHYHQLNEKLNELAILCAEYINKKGYNAYAQTTWAIAEYGVFRTVMPHKTVAVNAGLGWIGKSALFVTEEYGSAIKITSVLTDAPLTYNESLQESKCGECMLCTNACPGKAISGKNWSEKLDRDEYFDAMACRVKARELSLKHLNKQITLCGKCIEVCPFTRKYLAVVGE